MRFALNHITTPKLSVGDFVALAVDAMLDPQPVLVDGADRLDMRQIRETRRPRLRLADPEAALRASMAP
ncbi:hypothetical protein [Amaricoccus sp.]|uniref:hypothetical protein n=1 Tax=Amaricoccus sp. TaxID=1872485 RepID=UPI001B7C9895|nr:hypothetical protein [Amaricoccus sp.]MBP7240944.1 hypothetical protein [Amaricoccus sp.]